MLLRLAEIEFCSVTGEVRRGGAVHRLEPQPAALLAFLASRPGELISRQEIIGLLWGDSTHVKFQDALPYCVRQIRLALGDAARHPRFVETIPRRGYRLLVTPTPPASAPGHSTASTAPGEVAVDRSLLTRSAAVNRIALAAAAALLFAATALVERQPNRHHEVTVALLRAVHARIF